MRGRDGRSCRSRRRRLATGAARRRDTGLNELYHDAILAAARRSRPGARLDLPHGSATVDNPLCGDRVTVDVRLGRGGRVAQIGHVVRGCLLCEAAATFIAERAPDRAIEDLVRASGGIGTALQDGAAFPWPELEVFAPVRDVKSRHRCVGLPFEALVDALAGCSADAG